MITTAMRHQRAAHNGGHARQRIPLPEQRAADAERRRSLWSQTLWLSPRVLGYKSYAEFSRWHLRHTGDEFGMSDAWIMRHIGMDMDELLRLKQISGLAALFRDREFSTAQEAIE